MKAFLKVAAITAVGFSLLAPLIVQAQTTDEYTLTAYKNCQVVYQQPMSSVQIEAYQALRLQEQQMADVEANIDGIEAEMELFTDQIESLTELAIQETDETLFIDKEMLKQQEEVVAQFDAFMEQHQHKFDALGEQGEIIGEYADTFVDAIEADLVGIDYDDVEINTPDELGQRQGCYTRFISR